jgi:broad specificity phosphatase PhoE
VTDLLLIRHGEAAHNLDGRWEGWSSIPLTEKGCRQAEALARRLATWSSPITCLYASPLLRAWQTAKPIARALGLVPIAEDGLREIDFGRVSGLTLEGFRRSMPEVFARWQDRTDLTFQFPDGEQRRAFYRRVGHTLDGIAARHPGRQVLVVAHGGTLRAGLAHLFPDTMGDWWTYDLDNASLTHIRIDDGTKSLLTLNDCQHLSGDKEE